MSKVYRAFLGILRVVLGVLIWVIGEIISGAVPSGRWFFFDDDDYSQEEKQSEAQIKDFLFFLLSVLLAIPILVVLGLNLREEQLDHLLFVVTMMFPLMYILRTIAIKITKLGASVYYKLPKGKNQETVKPKREGLIDSSLEITNDNEGSDSGWPKDDQHSITNY